jgi:hypothetical protein
MAKWNHKIYVSPELFRDLKDWTLLHECEFLHKVYGLWPFLRDWPYCETKIVIDWKMTGFDWHANRP